MKQYHVSVNGQQPSVVAEDVLSKEAAEGKYPENTLIWCEGMAGWEPIGKHFRRSISPPPLPAAAVPAAGGGQPVRKDRPAKRSQVSVVQSDSGFSIPSHVWKACAWFMVSLFSLLAIIFDLFENNSRMHGKMWLLLFGSLGWGIYALESGGRKQNNKDKKS